MVLEKYYTKKAEDRIGTVETSLGTWKLREPDYAEFQSWVKTNSDRLQGMDLVEQVALLLQSFSTEQEITNADWDELVKDCGSFTQGDLLAFIEWYNIVNGGNLETVQRLIDSKNHQKR